MQTTEVSSQEGNSPPLVPGRQLLTSSLIITASRRVSSPSAPYGAEPRRYAVMSMKRRE